MANNLNNSNKLEVNNEDFKGFIANLEKKSRNSYIKFSFCQGNGEGHKIQKIY